MASRTSLRSIATLLTASHPTTLLSNSVNRRLLTTALQTPLRRAQLIQHTYPRSVLGLRQLSNELPQIRLYDFKAVKNMSESPSPKRTLIDVREPSEYAAGYIPTAINLPVNTQPDALTLSEEDFEDRYGFSKPPLDQEVIFYCKAGVRSGNAAAIAQQQGYTNVSEYKGSWTDWSKRGGKEAT